MRYTLDELDSADVVYALRMQRERMNETWVPSLREYASWYQINGRRLHPRQVLMHPGPVNRGVELSGEVVDSPQAVITAQVEAGVVVRMAVLYELLAGPREPRRRLADDGGVGALMAAQPLVHGPGQPADLLLRDVHVLDPRAALDARRDVRVRGGRIAELGEPGALDAGRRAGAHRGRGPPAPAAGVLRPARAPAHARPGAQGGPPDRHPRRRRRRLRRGARDAQHRPRARLGSAACARCATRPHAKRASRSAFCRRSPAAWRASS